MTDSTHRSRRLSAGRSRRFGLVAALGLSLVSSLALAGGTKQHRVADFDDFDDGEAEGTAIEGRGVVTMGYAHERGEVADVESVFTCYADARGRVVGTADEAAIYTVKAGKDGPTTERLAALEGAVVSAITRLPNGDLLAATLPGGKIFRIDAKGKTEVFAELEVEAIWALEIHESRVLAATGSKGELYSLALDGGGAKVILDVDESHLLSLAVIGKDIVVGTASHARIYQVGGKLEGELLHDFDADEVRAIEIVDGQLFAAVNDFDSRSIHNLQSLSKSLAQASFGGSPPSSSSVSAGEPDAKAYLYRVDLGPKSDLARASEAAWAPWLTRSKQYFTGMVPSGKGVLVSAAREGKVYRVRSLRDHATVADLEERQATGLCADKNGVLATAGDGAAVYDLQLARTKGNTTPAKYRSEIFDADQPAAYGRVQVLARGKFSLRARSGPSDEPDDRWTSWRPVQLRPDGAGLSGQLGVEKRRYLQLEVTLQSEDAELRDITIFYAPENLPPLLTEVAVAKPDFDLDDDEEPDATSKVTWKSEAKDDDELAYEVRLRREGAGDAWIVLNDGEPTDKKELELALDSVPDGVYEIGVTATDEPVNGSGKALRDELVSDPFVIDRTRPSLAEIQVDKGRITGRARDAGSYIHDVSYSVDEGSFRAASPSDGLFDGGDEKFEAQLRDLSPGPHRLVIRARDAHGNFVTVAREIER